MVLFVLIIIIIFGLIKKFFFAKKPKSLTDRHVVITGGSSGIGKSAAILAAQQGAHVTIIARNLQRLKDAEDEIRKATINTNQKITSVSADTSDPNIIQKLNQLEETIAPIYMLVACAGTAICGEVENFSPEDIKTLINTNFLSALYPLQGLIPKFKQRKEGILVLTASQVALMGMYGYSIYSSCKFALRGLAESVAMEVKPYNVTVTLALPPDTDTPGYEKENESKPEETKIISASGGLMRPEVVAKQLLKDALTGNFFSIIGIESYILTNLCVGMSPCNSLLESIGQFLSLGILRVIGVLFLKHFNNVAQKCYVNKQKSK